MLQVTICYFVPMERSYAARSRLFEEQHICPLGPSPWPAESEAFLGEGVDPSFDRAKCEEQVSPCSLFLYVCARTLEKEMQTPCTF